MIKLPEQVKTEITLDPKKAPIGKTLDVSSIKFTNGVQATYAQFTQHCTEFIDPHRVEIKKYKDRIAELEKALEEKSVPRKEKKHLTVIEWLRVDKQILMGKTNTEIAVEFDVSGSTISRRRGKITPKVDTLGAMEEYAEDLRE